MRVSILRNGEKGNLLKFGLDIEYLNDRNSVNKIVRGKILYWSERLGCYNALVSSTTHVCHLRQGETASHKKKSPRSLNGS